MQQLQALALMLCLCLFLQIVVIHGVPLGQQQGQLLKQHLLTSPGAFVPASASEWQHEFVSLPNTDDNANMMLKFTGTPGSEDGSNVAFVTNLNLSVATAVPTVTVAEGITLFPNPAKEMAYIDLTLADAANVQVQVLDAVGRVVNTISQDLQLEARRLKFLPATSLLVFIMLRSQQVVQ